MANRSDKTAGGTAATDADGSSDDAASADQMSWRDQAVARSLDSARSRAEMRVQRFLDAAVELMDGNENKEFTVQEVVERSGQSLRSFYQYFGGKHELLLALFEESIRSTADHLRAVVAAEKDPGKRLHRFVVEYYRVCRPASRTGARGKAAAKRSEEVPSSPVMVEFAQQLLTAHPAEAARSFVPLMEVFEAVLDEAAAAGVVRAKIDRRRAGGTVLGAIMFHAFAATIAGTSVEPEGADAAEELWDLLLLGLGGS